MLHKISDIVILSDVKELLGTCLGEMDKIVSKIGRGSMEVEMPSIGDLDEEERMFIN